MKSNPAYGWKSIAFSVVGILALLIIYFVISRKKPILSSDAASFFIIFVLGLMMSIFSGSRFVFVNNHQFPLTIVKILKVLGFAAFAVLFLTPILTWIGLKIPLLYGFNKGFITLSAIIVAKWLLVRATDIVMIFSK